MSTSLIALGLSRRLLRPACVACQVAGLIAAAGLALAPHACLALEVIALTPDSSNSSVAAFDTSLEVTVNDPFVFDPMSPANPLPAQNHPNGFHGNEPDGADVVLSYDFTNGPVTLGADQFFAVDLWGRTECCQARDDDIDVTLYSGGVLGTAVASELHQAIADGIQHTRVLVGGGGDSFDSLQLVAHDSADGGNLFTLMEIRATVLDDVLMKANVDRQSGAITLVNNTFDDINILGYKIASVAGAFDAAGWTTISGNYDASPGDGSVDASSMWTVLSAAGSAHDLSEGELQGGSGGVLTAGSTVDLGTPWIASPTEDITAELLLADGTVQSIPVIFNGDEVSFGDLDGNGSVDAGDWLAYLAGDQSDLTGLSAVQAYRAGDLNGDGRKNLSDMDLFIRTYDAANGAGAFGAVAAAVPEPASLAVLLIALVGGAARRRYAGRSLLLAAVVGLSLGALPRDASANWINWSPVIELVSDADIDTSGSIVAAVNGGPANAADIMVTIGGTDITFVSPDPSVFAGANLGAGGLPEIVTTGNAALDEVLDSHVWEGGSYPITAPISFSVSGLTVGQDYQIQIIGAADGRDCCSGRSQVFQDSPDGSGNNSGPVFRASDLSGGSEPMLHANAVTGSFRADAESQTIWVSGATDPGISGYVLSEIAQLQTLTLRVDTTTGAVGVYNDSSTSFELSGYELTSPAGTLAEATWNSFADQNLDPVGSGDGQTWLEDASSSAVTLSEGFLLGGTPISPTASQTLGSAYDPSILGVGSEGDLSFRFRTTSGQILSGLVEYVTSDPLDGDYNSDGVVNAADYTIWRDTFNSNTDLRADGDNSGVVDQADYALWSGNYGASSTGPAAQGATPEPSTLVLAGLIAVSGFSLRHRRNASGYAMQYLPMSRIGLASLAALFIVAWAVGGRTAQAAVTNDREYSFGDDSLENASPNTTVGSGSGNPTAGGTLDSMGPSGAYLDLVQSGGATYVDAAGLGSGRAGLAIRFDGVDDLLSGIQLNRPDALKAIVDSEGGDYPINYAGITARGLQGWVYPDAAAIGTPESPTTFQSVVFDTYYSGGPAISADGRWTQTNALHGDGLDGNSAVPVGSATVQGDVWQHVMHHNYVNAVPGSPRVVPGSGGANGFTSVLYVDGVAVSANNDSIPTGTVANHTGQLVVGAAEVANDGINPLFSHYFSGVVDDLDMYVFGDNETGVPGDLSDGENWGSFDLFADNEWIAGEIAATVPGGVLKPGDVTKDGVVNQSDIDAFIAGWLSTNEIQGANNRVTVGDWHTWDNGDMNHDGITDLADLFLLHQGLVAAGESGVSLAKLFGGGVPEPSSLCLLAVAAFPLCRRKRG